MTPEQRARRGRLRKSILDLVREDAARLGAKLGRHDRRKVDEYLTAVRELELRLEKTESAPPPQTQVELPKAIPRDYGEHIDLMQDLLVLAFQADLTRVATFMVANAGSNKTYRQVGVREGHHRLSHHGGDARKQGEIRKINRFPHRAVGSPDRQVRRGQGG